MRDAPKAKTARIGAALAVRDETVDVLTLAFVLFHLPRPAAGLREARRVLRAGGAVGLVTWSEGNPPLPGDEIWSEELDWLGADPDPREESVRRYDALDRPEKLTCLLRSAGFDAVETRTRRFEHRWDPGALVEVRRWCGPSGRRWATLPPAERRECLARIRERMAELSANHLVWRPEVVYAGGRVTEPGRTPT